MINVKHELDGHWIRPSTSGCAIVFIHGILSNSSTCWTNDSGISWPQMLSDETDYVTWGIYQFDYRADIFSKNYSLSDAVDYLYHTVNLELQDCNIILFVCHSMGGIVARKFLVNRSSELIQRGIQIGLFLVASPSLGSNYANFITAVANVVGIRNSQANALRFAQNNIWLNDLDKDFINLREANELPIHGIELVEDESIHAKKNWLHWLIRRLCKSQVVTPTSGARYFANSIKIPYSNHFTICKPNNRNSTQHRHLMQFISDLSKWTNEPYRANVEDPHHIEKTTSLSPQSINAPSFNHVTNSSNVNIVTNNYIAGSDLAEPANTLDQVSANASDALAKFGNLISQQTIATIQAKGVIDNLENAITQGKIKEILLESTNAELWIISAGSAAPKEMRAVIYTLLAKVELTFKAREAAAAGSRFDTAKASQFLKKAENER